MTVARSRRSASGLLLLTPHETEKSSDYCLNCEAGGVSGCFEYNINSPVDEKGHTGQ
jgi:hypothetical protein